MVAESCEHGVDWDATCRTCDAETAEATAAGAETPREIGLYFRGKDAGAKAAEAERDGWRRDATEHAARATATGYRLNGALRERDRLAVRLAEVERERDALESLHERLFVDGKLATRSDCDR